MSLSKMASPRLAVAALVLAPVAVGQGYSTDPKDIEAAYGGGQITWDSRGVPHVDANTNAGAFWGWGYAMSMDRYFQMEVARRTLKAELSELLGEYGPDPHLIGTWDFNVYQSDRRAKRLKMDFFARRMIADMQTNGVNQVELGYLDDFVAGINAYLTEQMGNTPPSGWEGMGTAAFQAGLENIDDLFEDYPLTWDRFDEWDVEDVVLCMWRLSEDVKMSKLDEQIGRTDLYDEKREDLDHEDAVVAVLGPLVYVEESMTVLEDDVELAGRWQSLQDYADEHGWTDQLVNKDTQSTTDPSVDPPKFSHGFAVHDDRTSDGGAVVVAMPQLDAEGWLYEIAVKGADFTCRGISFPGAPGFMVGFNESVAWGVTGAGASVTLPVYLEHGEIAGYTPEQTYEFEDVAHLVRTQEESFWKRTGPDSWAVETVWTDWALEVKHSDGTLEYGIPILNREVVNQNLLPSDQHVGLIHPRYYERSQDTVFAYLDMLWADNLEQLHTAVGQYTSPAVTMYAADDTGSIQYWYLKSILLHTSDVQVSPLGPYGMQTCTHETHLPKDLVPGRHLPWIKDPSNAWEGAPSNLDKIILSGNNAPVGDWYPFPTYSGVGETGRSWRLRQMLSKWLPTETWTFHELVGLSYDDVNSIRLATLHAARFSDEEDPNPVPDWLSPYARQFLGWLVNTVDNNGNDWIDLGGHMHANHKMAAGLMYADASFRHGPYPNLAARFGQVEAGKVKLMKKIMPYVIDEEDFLAPGHPEFTADQKTEIRAFFNKVMGNVAVRIRFGRNELGSNDHDYVKYTGPHPGNWRPQFHSRSVDLRKESKSKTSGARYTALFHNAITGFGSLDTDHDRVSEVLHNSNDGIGNQHESFYVQCVQFTENGPVAHVVMHPGNSMRPGTTYWETTTINGLWEQDGKEFNLGDVQTNDPFEFYESVTLIPID